MTPFFSIVVPVYNVEKYLDRCLESLLGQTYGDYEVIMVDDGSPDGSNAICKRWTQRDQRFHLVEKKNAGLGFARNTGLDHAQGQYVMYIDSDDYIVPESLQKIHDRLLDTGADVCYFGFFEIHPEGTTYGKPPKKLVYEGPEEMLNFIHQILGPAPDSKEFLFSGVSACGGAYRRAFLEEQNPPIRFLSERQCLCEDEFYNLNVCMRVRKIAILPECLYAYCFNSTNSITTRYRPDRLEASISMYQLLIDAMRQAGLGDAETMQRVDRSLMQNLIVCLRQEAQHVKKNGLAAALKHIGILCRNETVQQVLGRYPIGRMPKAQKLLFILMKHKLTPLVYALAWARYGR